MLGQEKKSGCCYDSQNLEKTPSKKKVFSKTELAIKKWKKKRGSLIMALHEIQDLKGFLPWEDAVEVAEGMNVPLARVYEVLTFYNYFKLEAPGDIIISVCYGTACYLKGVKDVLDEFSEKLGIADGESTEDKMFHLQTVRCVGCCGLAPVVVINGKTYGKVRPSDVRGMIEEWQEKHAAKNSVDGASDGE